MSLALTIVVWTAGTLDAESFSVSLMAVSDSVVDRAVVDWVGAFEGWPGHSQAMSSAKPVKNYKHL